jgi:hypothetical protein
LAHPEARTAAGDPAQASAALELGAETRGNAGILPLDGAKATLYSLPLS